MNTSAIASRLIGDIFVDEGLINETQLEHALDEQQKTGQRLGEILVARFGVTRLDLSSALLEQLAEHEASATTEDDHTSERRDLEALASEWSTTEGEILVEQGLLSREQLMSEVSQQLKGLQLPTPPASLADDTAIGERLAQVEQQLTDTVTPAQLSERVQSLTTGMSKLGRLSDELAIRLSLLQTHGLDTIAGEVKVLRAELSDHGHVELGGTIERVAKLELRLAAAATSAELDERLERALAAHAAELEPGLDALAHSIKQAASSHDLSRLSRKVELLADATADTNEAAARRLQQLEARTGEAEAAEERLRAALTATADRSAAADERMRESLVEVVDLTTRNLAEQRTELHAHLGGEVQKLETAAAESLTSLRGSVDELATQLAEQRRRLEARMRTDVERLDARIDQQDVRADEHSAGAARATELLEQELQRVESELRVRLERHSDRIDAERRALEEVRDAGEQALKAATAGLTQRLADVEQHAARSTSGLKADLGALGEKIADQAVEAAQESATARAGLDHVRTRIDDLSGRLEGHEHRTARDTANAQEDVDEIRSGLGALGNRLDDYGRSTTGQLDAVRKDLGASHVHVEQLSERLHDETARAAAATTAVRGDLESLQESLVEREAASDQRLSSLVKSASARTDGRLDVLAERSTVDALRERVDEHGKLIADSGLRQHETSTELGRRLGRLGQELEQCFSRIDSSRQEASDELELTWASLREEQLDLAATLRAEQERSLSSLQEDVGQLERRALAGLAQHEASLGDTNVELADLRREVVENDRQRRQSDKALEALNDELRGEIAIVLERVADGELARGRGDELLCTRIEALGQQLASESASAAEAALAEREALRDGLELLVRRLDHVGPHPPRMEAATTAGSHTRPLSQVEEPSRSRGARLAGAQVAAQSPDVDELRAQVVELQSQILAQAEAAEQLRQRFAEIESKLSDTRRTLPVAADEPSGTSLTYLAFAPDKNNRYTMIECPGELPAVGQRVEVAGFGGGTLVVSRVTDSPLPHDTRPCVYLEGAS